MVAGESGLQDLRGALLSAWHTWIGSQLTLSPTNHGKGAGNPEAAARENMKDNLLIATLGLEIATTLSKWILA